MYICMCLRNATGMHAHKFLWARCCFHAHAVRFAVEQERMHYNGVSSTVQKQVAYSIRVAAESAVINVLRNTNASRG